MAALTQTYFVLWFVQVFQVLVTIGLMRQYKVLQEVANEEGIARNKLRVGTNAPALELLDLRTSQPYHFGKGQNGGRVLLFLSPKCSLCMDIVRHLANQPATSLAKLIPVCLGSDLDSKRLLKRLPAPVPMLSDPTRAFSRLYGVSTAPETIVVTPLQKIRGYGHPSNGQDVLELLSDSEIDYELDAAHDQSTSPISDVNEGGNTETEYDESKPQHKNSHARTSASLPDRRHITQRPSGAI